MIHKRIGIQAGTIMRQTRTLGLDLTMGRTRPRKVQQERIKNMARRAGRLYAAKAKSAPARRIFYAGILPAVLYGVEMVGMSDTAMKKITTAALRAQCADIKGARRDALWSILGAAKDPRCNLHLASLKRYHREWWAANLENRHADNLTPHELASAWGAS